MPNGRDKGARCFDVVVIGGGMSGMATAARLQARGLSTVVLEAHGLVGGCAGYFRKSGYSFDVGATTLVDFEPGGVGGGLLEEIGLDADCGDDLPGYVAWLPDRTVTLYRDHELWTVERASKLGDTPGHRKFWRLLDELADVFWDAARHGARLPVTSARGVREAARTVPWQKWHLARYLTWSMEDAMRHAGVNDDDALRGLVSMLLEDTVHASPGNAPLVNGALGLTIRGAGLKRATGGMRGFWETLTARYRELGGVLRVGTRVERVRRSPDGAFEVATRRGSFYGTQVVSSLPIWNSRDLMPEVAEGLSRFCERDATSLGGAVVMFMGVSEDEVNDSAFTHHQILDDYRRPLGRGNNMFISVSTRGDSLSAPTGHRAVMVSTHTELSDWEGLGEGEYAERKHEIGETLLSHARRVYPRLGERATVVEVGTPRTYSKYTHRYRGATGGIRATPRNSNQHAVPYDIGVAGYWQVGDTTWPGLGTVACVLASSHVADGVVAAAKRIGRRGVVRSLPVRQQARNRNAATPARHTPTLGLRLVDLGGFGSQAEREQCPSLLEHCRASEVPETPGGALRALARCAAPCVHCEQRTPPANR